MRPDERDHEITFDYIQAHALSRALVADLRRVIGFSPQISEKLASDLTGVLDIAIELAQFLNSAVVRDHRLDQVIEVRLNFARDAIRALNANLITRTDLAQVASHTLELLVDLATELTRVLASTLGRDRTFRRLVKKNEIVAFEFENLHVITDKLASSLDSLHERTMISVPTPDGMSKWASRFARLALWGLSATDRARYRLENTQDLMNLATHGASRWRQYKHSLGLIATSWALQKEKGRNPWGVHVSNRYKEW
ncbi:hypothetical protein DMH04_00130 [Kibdelosporangium aridum]|uniref:Uncharacterized protein n=1 Tax=Kibdelosporangium aridum TaxID=2030 RepID=A0A428ZTV0_KIBAR|nr:hypothetical protein [Kibdelosporangium aridum]RSM91457.1 hypothetical protein DMH04_00130 [Kibdelosporangium aridum]